MALSIIILAAGRGQRMRSTLPKVLHRLGHKPLLEHVVETALQLPVQGPPIIIYGHQGALLRDKLAHLKVTWVQQEEQRGTAHAVQQALPYIPAENTVLILSGDVPLISSSTLTKLLQETQEDGLGLITTVLNDPSGLGRIKRNAHGNIYAIVEEKDASAQERTITEINAGIYFVKAALLKKWLPAIQNNNAQKEYYLTEITQQAILENCPIFSSKPENEYEILGVNTSAQLANLERIYQHIQADKLLAQGVTLYDPNRLDVRGNIRVGTDVTIDVNVIFEGNVSIGNHCTIGANSILRNVILKDHVTIHPHCIIESSEFAAYSKIGPFARVRANTIIGERAEIGNFIEIKNSTLGSDTKAHHVSYLGDSEIGKQVNIGAGTITCNYDGANKHKTTIGDGAFIGSNSELVAPVCIGEGATIGAGSTITKDAPAHQLTLTRGTQRSISTWKRKRKLKEKA